MKLHQCLRSQPATAFLAAGLLVAGSGALLSRNGAADASLVSAREFSEAFRNVARTIGPSVVSVVAIHEPKTAPTSRYQDQEVPAPFEDPFLRRGVFRVELRAGRLGRGPAGLLRLQVDGERQPKHQGDRPQQDAVESSHENGPPATMGPRGPARNSCFFESQGEPS